MSDETRACDYPEDAAHENGNYVSKCIQCGESFIGHKRRFVCKRCASLPPTPDPRERGDAPPDCMLTAAEVARLCLRRRADDGGVMSYADARAVEAAVLAKVAALRAPAPSEAVDERIVRHPNGHLMVERVPAWVPTEEQTSEALKSLGKAWPYLADNAPHIDGEFNTAHGNLTRYVERFRELLATHPAPARGVTVTEAMVERAMGVECGSTHHEHHPPDCRRCWQAKLTAALTPDAEGGA